MLENPESFLDQDNGWLKSEVKYLHWALFGRLPSASIVERYIRAHAELQALSVVPHEQLRTVRTIIANRLDAGAIEPWLRCGRLNHVLSRKLLLIAYLAECGAKYAEFRQPSYGRCRSWFVMVCSALLAMVKLFRGRYLKMRYGLL